MFTIQIFVLCSAWCIRSYNACIFQFDDTLDANVTDDNTSNCTELEASDYWGITWTAAAELPGAHDSLFYSLVSVAIAEVSYIHAGILLTLVLIELLGRKKTMFIEFLLTGVGFFLLFICTKE